MKQKHGHLGVRAVLSKWMIPPVVYIYIFIVIFLILYEMIWVINMDYKPLTKWDAHPIKLSKEVK